MSHQHVYGFCESKCKVEVPSLELFNDFRGGVENRVSVLENNTLSLSNIINLKTVVDSYSQLSNLTGLVAGDKVFCWEYVNNLPRIYTWNGSSWTAQANGEVPKNFIEYFVKDKGHSISFYQIKADTTNYLDIEVGAGGSNLGIDRNTLNILCLPPNMYIIGSLSSYWQRSVTYTNATHVSQIKYTNSTSQILKTDAVGSSVTNYTIPAKTNSIMLYAAIGLTGNNTGVYSYYLKLFAGFTVVE